MFLDLLVRFGNKTVQIANVIHIDNWTRTHATNETRKDTQESKIQRDAQQEQHANNGERSETTGTPKKTEERRNSQENQSLNQSPFHGASQFGCLLMLHLVCKVNIREGLFRRFGRGNGRCFG
jgi:hypothetical protein